MADVNSIRQEQFDDFEQQHDASWIGMWVFLATEVMFFGGMFTGYTVYRWAHITAFADASNHLDFWLGSINTAILICSSFTVAAGVHAAETGKSRSLLIFLTLTMVLGAIFLGIKFHEYFVKYEEHLIPGLRFHYEEPSLARPAEIFFSFYFAMTGMHALHMIIGLGLLSYLAIQTARDRFSPDYYTPVELTGLYWHFVDIIWIFLYPLLYLVGRHL